MLKDGSAMDSNFRVRASGVEKPQRQGLHLEIGALGQGDNLLK